MKICSKCKEVKEYSEFYASKRSPDGYTAACKACQSAWAKEKYKQNEIYRLSKNENSKKNRKERREYVWDYLREHSCVDCGESDIRVLEFDHVRGKKIIGITKAIQTGWDILLEELPKCEVRCANCHRKKTYTQLGWNVPD